MGATKRLFERMFDRHDYHEIHFRMLEEEYYMKCSRCDEKHHRDSMYYADHPDYALCDCCNGDLNG